MTSYLCFLILLVTSAVNGTTFRKTQKRNYDDSGEAYSSYSGSAAFKGSGRGYQGAEGRSSQNKRDFNAGYDGDDYIPPVGIQHNNDYSGLGDGYQDYASGGTGGTGAISYSHVVTEHRPVQRVQASRIRAEGTNVIEKPVPFPLKVQIPIVPAFDRPQYLPLVPLTPVTPAVIAPVKYPIQFFKPISYLAPEKQNSAPAKGEQPEYVLTKVPLVYHASYSETPASQSSFNPASVNINHALSNLNSKSNFNLAAFNHGVNSYNQNFNHGNHFNRGNSFDHGSNSFNHGNSLSHLNPQISTPGTPSFSHFPHVPAPSPLVPTPTPYHHHHHHHSH